MEIYYGATMPASNTVFGATNILPISLLVSGGNVSLTTTQSTFLYQVLSGSVPAGGFILTYPLVGVFQLDTSGVNFSSGGVITLVFGTASVVLSTNSIFTVSLPLANTITILAAVGATNTIIATTGGAINLTPAQQLCSSITLTGSLSSILTITWNTPPTNGYQVILDCTGINYNSFYYIVLVINGNANANHISASTPYLLYYSHIGHMAFVQIPN